MPISSKETSGLSIQSRKGKMNVNYLCVEFFHTSSRLSSGAFIIIEPIMKYV